MGAGWRRLAVAGGLRLAVLGLIGALGAAAVGGGTATLTAVRAQADGKPGPGQLSSAQHLVAARAAMLARAAAKADTLSAALSGLRTQAEALAERYDHEVSLEQQASAAYQAAQTPGWRRRGSPSGARPRSSPSWPPPSTSPMAARAWRRRYSRASPIPAATWARSACSRRWAISKPTCWPRRRPT